MTTDLHRFQGGHNEAVGWRAFRFPNDHTASVVPDPRTDQLFRWEVLSSDPADAGRGGVVPACPPRRWRRSSPPSTTCPTSRPRRTDRP